MYLVSPSCSVFVVLLWSLQLSSSSFFVVSFFIGLFFQSKNKINSKTETKNWQVCWNQQKMEEEVDLRKLEIILSARL